MVSLSQGVQPSASQPNDGQCPDGLLFASTMGTESNKESTSNPSTGQQLLNVSNPSVADIAVKDLDHDGLYGPQDVPNDYIIPTNTQAAAAVAQRIASDPNVKVAFIGETHSDSATNRFVDIIKQTNQQLASTGRSAIAVIETPTTPELDSLIQNYQSGKVSETEFLDKGSKILNDVYTDAYKNHGVPLGMEKERPAPLDQQYWRERLTQDVVTYNKEGIKVAFADDGRFVPGQNRDEVIANKILKIQKENPNSVLVGEFGLLHSQESASIDLLNDYKVDGGSPPNSWQYKGAVISKGDEKNPAASRVAKELGGQSVLTFAMDDAFKYNGAMYLNDWYGPEESVEKPVGKAMSPNSFDYVIPNWDPAETDNPNLPTVTQQDPYVSPTS